MDNKKEIKKEVNLRNVLKKIIKKGKYNKTISNKKRLS